MTSKGFRRFRTIFVVALLLLNYSAVAQVSITSDDMPSAGDTIRFSNALSTGGIDYTLTGENYVWDFASMNPLIQSVDTFASVTSVPFLYQLVFIPGFVANLAQKYPGIDTLGLPVTDPYRFFKNTSSSFDDVGIAVTVSGFPLPLRFDNPDVIYNFPVEFNNSNTSYSGVELEIPDIGFISIDRERVNEVDGWGTLTTSMGTFDVLRMKSSVTEKDSIYIDSVNFGQTLNRNYIEYKWLSPEFIQPLLQVTEEGQLLTVAWIDSVRGPVTSVPDYLVEEPSMQIIPNPVSQSGKIVIHQNENGFVSISLFDVTGVKIGSIHQGELPRGTSSIGLGPIVGKLSSGIYFVRMQSAGKVITQKLVVR